MAEVTAAPAPAASTAASTPSPSVSEATASARSSFTGSMTRAPSAAMIARRSSLGSDTSTFSTPRALKANQVPIPIGPAPATSALPPGRTPLRATACQPTAMGSTSAPILRSTPSGSTCTFDASHTVNSDRPPPSTFDPSEPISGHEKGSPRRQAAHLPQETARGKTAQRSPTRTSVTPSPVSTTVPENS